MSSVYINMKRVKETFGGLATTFLLLTTICVTNSTAPTKLKFSNEYLVQYEVIAAAEWGVTTGRLPRVVWDNDLSNKLLWGQYQDWGVTSTISIATDINLNCLQAVMTHEVGLV